MDELTSFLRARLAEDEATAIGARESEFCEDGRWVVRGPFGDSQLLGSVQSEVSEAILGEDTDDVPFPLALHVARHDPARTLADVEAKRRLIDWVLRWPMRPAPPSSVNGVLELLALPYADHPDYRKDWRP
ncbi:DUF6221 family protein [Streptomyces sp. NPDC056749]|uniref:DUF6221 family protein n=1 Tax=Streptomyces sp. NPDC056749 TaxID=3345936 RepID=UPI0036AFABEB